MHPMSDIKISHFCKSIKFHTILIPPATDSIWYLSYSTIVLALLYLININICILYHYYSNYRWTINLAFITSVLKHSLSLLVYVHISIQTIDSVRLPNQSYCQQIQLCKCTSLQLLAELYSYIYGDENLFVIKHKVQCLGHKISDMSPFGVTSAVKVSKFFGIFDFSNWTFQKNFDAGSERADSYWKE